ncbi:hypothetical protein C8N25_11083 [Algoriphagus antarcticus]|uniref:Uncharacterized protein n=1 Tax=Algoriphagus antarcticus TaxID=238540 RepID=A0A3E0DUX7_9BACT|nr:hypothetical protein C8N25_11083 [Algoriphagus antarcticus]
MEKAGLKVEFEKYTEPPSFIFLLPNNPKPWKLVMKNILQKLSMRWRDGLIGKFHLKHLITLQDFLNSRLVE